jgi:hypothetical protein
MPTLIKLCCEPHRMRALCNVLRAAETNEQPDWLRSDIGRLNELIRFCPLTIGTHDLAAQLKRLNFDRSEALSRLKRLHLTPAPFSPSYPIFNANEMVEIRTYCYDPCSLTELLVRWGQRIEDRIRHSPLLFCGHGMEDGVFVWLSVWSYRDLNQRQQVRADVVRQGIWPPGVFAGLRSQESAIYVPAS